MEKKKLIDEIEWIFRDYKFNNHLGVEIKNGKFVNNEFVEKKRILDVVFVIC